MKRVVIFFVAFCWLVACRSNERIANRSKPPIPSEKQISLKRNAQINIELPQDLIVNGLTQVCFSVNDSTLYIYDQFKNRLLSYFFPEQKFKKTISVGEQLPSGFTVTGMTFHNADTIALYDYSKKQLCLFNLNGEVFKTLKLSIPKYTETSKVWYPSPIISNEAPAFFKNGRIYLVGYVSGEGESEKFEGRLISSVVSIRDNSINFSMPYPAVYKDRNYGGFYFRIPYATTNYAKGIALISLPASHDVIQLNLSDHATKITNLSPPFEIDIPAMEQSKEQLAIKKNIAAEHYSINYSYRNIIYHPYKDVYMRILENPVPKNNLNSDKLGYKNCTILLFDADFKFIGQSPLEYYLSTDNFFITPDGICFMKANNRNEDVCQYVCYKFD